MMMSQISETAAWAVRLEDKSIILENIVKADVLCENVNRASAFLVFVCKKKFGIDSLAALWFTVKSKGGKNENRKRGV